MRSKVNEFVMKIRTIEYKDKRIKHVNLMQKTRIPRKVPNFKPGRKRDDVGKGNGLISA